jgi:hypothetical protein
VGLGHVFTLEIEIEMGCAGAVLPLAVRWEDRQTDRKTLRLKDRKAR